MAEVLPLKALHYDLRAVGSLDAVAAPPYDVIDDAMRAELVAKSPFNVVEVDLPRAPGGGDPPPPPPAPPGGGAQEGLGPRPPRPAPPPRHEDHHPPGGRPPHPARV